MIIDQLSNFTFYQALHPRLARALTILRDGALQPRPPGRHDIDGQEMYAIVNEYITELQTQGKWEAHRKYWDVQLVVSGVERMGYANIRNMTVAQPYDAACDAEFFDGAGSFLTVHAGMFAVFAPHDVHMPGIADGAPGPVRKIVVKVAMDG